VEIQTKKIERDGNANAGNDQQALPAEFVHDEGRGHSRDNCGEAQSHHHD